MKILTVSDVVEPQLYQASIRERYADVDLVLGCGDLQLLPGVHRHHAQQATVLRLWQPRSAPDSYTEGHKTQRTERLRISLDGRTTHFKGLLLAGLEGSMRYKRDGGPQYNDREMWYKVLRLAPWLVWNRWHHGRYLDILVTHAPPYGVHDGNDLCHTGFRAYLWLMKRFRPRYLIHGHVHLYHPAAARRTPYGSTLVINTYGHQIIEWNRSSPTAMPARKTWH